MHILHYNQFILEKYGVSDASLIFFDILDMRVTGIFEDFIKSKEKKINIEEKLNYQSLKPFLTKNKIENYSKFPVIEFEIQLDFKKMTERTWEKEYPMLIDKRIATGGVASFFGNKNWSGYSKIVNPIKQVSNVGIIVNLGVSIDVHPDFSLENSEDLSVLHDDIGSTLYHELNHCFEHYVRVISNKEIMRPESRSFNTTLTYSGQNIWKFPKFIWKYFNIFNYYLYWSEFHETRANVQEIAFFINKYPEKELEEFKIYQVANDMENFNSEVFYNEFINVISRYESYKGIEETIAERFKEMWIKSYEKSCKDQDVRAIISLNTLNKMNCLEFFKYWQKRINSAGKTIKRKANNIKYEEIYQSSRKSK
jgi:hypothetical protein